MSVPWSRITAALRARDPGARVTRRAARAAIVLPLNLAIGITVIGDPIVATFAAFGTFSLLLLAWPKGPRATQLVAYAMVALLGAVLITIATLAARPTWLAVVVVAAASFVVLYAGVASSVVNDSNPAVLIPLILAATLPPDPSSLPARLAGWGLAVLLAVPVAVFAWPARNRDALRVNAAALCDELAAHLVGGRPRAVTIAQVGAAAQGLVDALEAASVRTGGVTERARLLADLVDELIWIAAIASEEPAGGDGMPAQAQNLREAAAEALRVCAALACADRSERQAHVDALRGLLVELDRSHRDVGTSTVPELLQARTTPGSGTADGPGLTLYWTYELGCAVLMVSRTALALADADARPLGGTVAGVRRTIGGHVDWHGVWLHNSLRGAAGLAIAVALARSFGAQNAYWIGIGAFSVLRSNVMTTGLTAARALAGTLAGFVVGGALVTLIGTDHAVLWAILPLAVFVAGYASGTTTFAVGQAAFTVFLIVLLNIVAPSGWHVGVVRIEDVLLGCLASLVAGVLLWPRGATAALGIAVGEALRASASALGAAVGGAGPATSADRAARQAEAASARLDEALRAYLGERGAKRAPLPAVAVLASGTTRLRLTARAISELVPAVPESGRLQAHAQLAGTRAAMRERAGAVVAWYGELADAFESGPLPQRPAEDEDFLDTVLATVAVAGSDAAGRRPCRELLWTWQHVATVSAMRTQLLAAAEQFAGVRSDGVPGAAAAPKDGLEGALLRLR